MKSKKSSKPSLGTTRTRNKRRRHPQEAGSLAFFLFHFKLTTRKSYGKKTKEYDFSLPSYNRYRTNSLCKGKGSADDAGEGLKEAPSECFAFFGDVW